jgi:hypothetical protein
VSVHGVISEIHAVVVFYGNITLRPMISGVYLNCNI